MKYILIFLVITDAEFGAYSLTAEFDDKPACMDVLEKLRLTREGTFDHIEKHSASVVEGCYPKGSAK